MTAWTKELVQQHARDAVAVELYTIPFYITVMTSIKNTESDAYKIIRGVLIEEMMHLQLVANLCVALDTTPNLQVPNYEIDVPFVEPGTVLDADMGPLDAKRLKMMIDIETPEEIVNDGTRKRSPDYPYSSIGEMYDALFYGIKQVGENQFSWNTARQQVFWAEQGYPQIIRNCSEAEKAFEAIKAQGEGGHDGQAVTIDERLQMINRPPVNIIWPYQDIFLKEYSHYSRFLTIQNGGLPDVFHGVISPNHPANMALQEIFRGNQQILDDLNHFWTGPITPVWMKFIGSMRELTKRARQCWESGVIPDWGKP